MNLRVTIPVLPHVGKYLRTKYPTGVYKLAADPVSSLLADMLRSSKSDPRKDTYLYRYSDRFILELSVPEGKADRFRFNSYKIIRFNDAIEWQIKQEMYGLLDSRTRKPIRKVAEGIRNFMQFYNFDESDIQYETLKKSYQRKKTAQIA